MTLKDYPITFGYKAQDGYYYGPHGTVGKYHRGADRACPIGVQVVIDGTTIGLTGNTGASSGPHCHIQAMIGTNDTNPAPYEFKGGTVVKAGFQPDFGNHIRIDVGGGVIVIYAHLSKINVSVGQVISNIGDEDMIQDGDNYFNRWNKLHKQVRGRYSDRAMFKDFIGKTWLNCIEIFSDSDEADINVADADCGRTARVENWQGQMQELKTQVSSLSTRPTRAELDAVAAKAAELDAALTQANATKTEDTILLDNAGSWISKLINRLFKKG